MQPNLSRWWSVAQSETSVIAAPLAGIRVLDVTRSIAGPWTARLLGDAGAEVIKVEPPQTGDMLRLFPVRTSDYDTAFFRQANAGKKSICVDLHTDKGRELVAMLAAQCDVVVQNMRPAAAARSGLTFGQLATLNPNIIVCGISGFGHGNFPGRPGNDIAAQAMSGIASMSGSDGRPPIVSMWSLTDTFTSIHAFNAICAALIARDRGAGGCFIDMAITRCAMQLHDVGPTLAKLRPGHPLSRGGRFHPFLVVRGVVATSDGFVAVSAFRTTTWRRLAPLLGGPFVAQELDDSVKRLDSRQRILERLDEVAAGHNTNSLSATLADLGVPSAPVEMSFPRVLNKLVESHSTAIVPLDQPGYPNAALGNTILHPKRGAERLEAGSPRLGADAFQVLTEILGRSSEDVQQLLLEGVIDAEPSVIAEILDKCTDA